MPSACRTPTSRSRGVRVLRETITSIDPEARRVTTDAGVHEADVLVVALGADYDMEATPGLAEAGTSSIPSRARRGWRRCSRRSAGPRDRRCLRGAVQVPAGAERGRALAPRLSLGAGRPWRMRDLDRDSFDDSGPSLARHIGGPGHRLRGVWNRVRCGPPCRLAGRRAARCSTTAASSLRPVPGRPPAPRSRRRDRQRHDGGRVRARQPEDTGDAVPRRLRGRGRRHDRRAEGGRLRGGRSPRRRARP